MKAMIFAAGCGTRLRPLTLTVPKALVDINGTPALGLLLKRLADCGTDEAVVNVHHLAGIIKEYLQDNIPAGMKITVSDESEMLLDTGGAFLAARSVLKSWDEPFLVHNADIITDTDLTALMEAHIVSGADVTLLCQHRKSSRAFLSDSTGRLRGWARTDGSESIIPGENTPASELTPLAFAGVSVVSPSVFPAIERYAAAHGPVFSTTPFYASRCGELDIRCHVAAKDYRWCDIGNPASLEKAREMFRQ